MPSVDLRVMGVFYGDTLNLGEKLIVMAGGFTNKYFTIYPTEDFALKNGTFSLSTKTK